MRIALLLVTLNLFNCSPRGEVGLASNQTVQKVFSASEIKDLSELLLFFEKSICGVQGVSDSKKCYERYFKDLELSVKKGEVIINIPYEDQQNLYKELDQATFNEIWSLRRNIDFQSGDTLKSIGYKYDGKFTKFLELTGKDNPLINEYYENFIDAGDISPAMIAGLIKNHEKYDINDIRVRLVIAIHYLTMNDQFYRKEQY